MNATRRSIVAITTLIVLMVVSLAGLFAAGASAGTLVHPQNAVAPIAVPGGQIVGVPQPVLAGQHRVRAPDYDRMAVGSSVAAEEGAGGGIGGTTAALQEHLAGAVERFGAEGLTEGQQSALVDNPGLESAFRGQRMDTFFKESLNNAIESGTDSRVANLYVTRPGELGPDVFDLGGMNHWWDVTTPGSWAQHVADYADFGTGIPLFTP